MYGSIRRCPRIWGQTYCFSKTFPFVFSLCMSVLNAFTLHRSNRPHILNNKVDNFLRDINLVSIFRLDERGGFRSNLVCVKLPPLSDAEAECAWSYITIIRSNWYANSDTVDLIHWELDEHLLADELALLFFRWYVTLIVGLWYPNCCLRSLHSTFLLVTCFNKLLPHTRTSFMCILMINI